MFVSGEYCCYEGTLVEGILSMVSEEGAPIRFVLFCPFGINNVSNYWLQIASVSASFIIHNIIKFSDCKVSFHTAL